MSKPLTDCRAAINEWLRSVYLNTAVDVVAPQGDVGTFRCTYHRNVAKGVDGLTLAETTVRVYVSRAHEDSAHAGADAAQSDLQESLEAWGGPWTQLLVTDSDVADEVRGETTYVTVRFAVQMWV